MAQIKALVICGPSGSGKSTLIQKAIREFPDNLKTVIGHTTRTIRENETNQVDFHFTTREQMEEDISQGRFIENVEYDGNLYGTSEEAVRQVTNLNKVCVLSLNIEGVENIKNRQDFNANYVFINPPSIEELERRLRLRGTQNEASLSYRLNRAREEIEYGTRDGNFNLIITNDNVDSAFNILKEFIIRDVINN